MAHSIRGLRPDVRACGPVRFERRACACEHASHAGACILDRDVREVRTVYGTFPTCAACRERHPMPDRYLASNPVPPLLAALDVLDAAEGR